MKTDYSVPSTSALLPCLTGVEVQLRMAGDSRVLMDHNMEIGVTPAQVSCTAFTGHGRDGSKKTMDR